MVERTNDPERTSRRRGLYDPSFEHDACGVAFVVDIKGRKSHQVVSDALLALEHLRHRGASGSDAATGDGAGILLQVPDRLLRRECKSLGIPLPPAEQYAVGTVFLPCSGEAARSCRGMFGSLAARMGLRVLGWRPVPRDDSYIGASARSSQPCIEQVFVERPDGVDADAFERRLYLLRRRVECAAETSALAELYVPSLSSRTLVYKGMLSADQLPMYYSDLRDPDIESALAIVHQRFSTNTFPSWSLAHPFRFIAHNGEINT
ncbi:MAG: glutamate synthase subunit alpha, partial [Chloroflexota bacterium]|nr:glutamate synthase subunit alpha [Chloroflexota bacterium]